MAQNTVARSAKLSHIFGLDAVDWSLLLGGIVLIGLLALLV